MKARTKAAKIRQRKTAKPMRPGRKELPETAAREGGTTVFRLPPRQRRTPAPMINGGESSIGRREVEARLMRAMKTIRATPDKDRRFFVVKGGSPDYVREYIDAYDPSIRAEPHFVPSPSDISDCLTALSWARHLDHVEWKVMWLRSFGFSFGLIAEYIGRSDETARRRYEGALTNAWCAASGYSARGVA